MSTAKTPAAPSGRISEKNYIDTVLIILYLVYFTNTFQLNSISFLEMVIFMVYENLNRITKIALYQIYHNN